ncbi:MAG: response regulator [Eubacteriales bacterium]|nr:response regulator [Eubacteriales bacterium]
MNIVAVDDEKYALEGLVEAIAEVKKDASLVSFSNSKDVLEYAKDNKIDVAFLDIELGSMTGIEVAKKLKIINPHINIVFVTGYNQYMRDAIHLRASGYVEKPVSKEDIAEELGNLRNPLPDKENVLVAKCFGNFDVFVNGESLKFERSKTKEMLAYLVDRRGAAVTSGELCAVLWENADSDHNTGIYLQKLKKDLINTLKDAGVEDTFKTSWNKYAVDPDKISCDYYDFLNNIPEGIRAYNGEYMSQYSWGEPQNVLLYDMDKKIE